MAKASNPVSRGAIWILMTLLILSLGGFGITQLGGTLRSLGEVGDKQIDIDQYARQLSQELNALAQQRGRAVPFAEAQSLGLDQAVLARIVQARAYDHEAAQLGLSVGDEALRDELLSIPAFQGLDGQFDRTTYTLALDQIGLTEAQFENQLREDAARGLLQGAIASGAQMPDTFARTLADFFGETRAVTLLPVTEGTLAAPLPAPTQADLRSFHAENPDLFQIPALRQLTYVLLTPEMMADEIALDEAMLRKAYDERAAEFNQPERRLVERLPFLNAAEADAAAAQLEVGGTTFDALVQERGLTLADIDLGDVSESDLGSAATPVFEAQSGDVVGPVPTDLGPALFRVNAILPAQSTSFDQARADLQAELATDRAERLIDTLAEDFDDQLAGGATLEQLAEESQMQLAQIDWHEDVEADIAGYNAFRRAAASVAQGDFPQIQPLDEGGIFALRLDGTSDARPATFDEAGGEVEAQLRATRRKAALEERAQEIMLELFEGADPLSLGITPRTEPEVSRSSFLPGLPTDAITQIFEMEPGALEVIAGADMVYLLRLDAISAASDNAQAEVLRTQLSAQLDQALGQDLLAAFGQDVLLRAGQRIDQRALQAVHVNFP